MMVDHRLNSLFLIACLIGIFTKLSWSNAYVLDNVQNLDDNTLKENPEKLVEFLNKLRETYTNLLNQDDDEFLYAKRGLDLGLGRGFSGSQAAKHRMGMAVANFAGGPGRRRRNNN